MVPSESTAKTSIREVPENVAEIPELIVPADGRSAQLSHVGLLWLDLYETTPLLLAANTNNRLPGSHTTPGCKLARLPGWPGAPIGNQPFQAPVPRQA